MLAEDELRDAVLLVFANKQVKERKTKFFKRKLLISSPSIHLVPFLTSLLWLTSCMTVSLIGLGINTVVLI